MSNNNLAPLDINLEKDKKITKWSDKTFDKIGENIKEKTGDILENKEELNQDYKEYKEGMPINISPELNSELILIELKKDFPNIRIENINSLIEDISEEFKKIEPIKCGENYYLEPKYGIKYNKSREYYPRDARNSNSETFKSATISLPKITNTNIISGGYIKGKNILIYINENSENKDFKQKYPNLFNNGKLLIPNSINNIDIDLSKKSKKELNQLIDYILKVNISPKNKYEILSEFNKLEYLTIDVIGSIIIDIKNGENYTNFSNIFSINFNFLKNPIFENNKRNITNLKDFFKLLLSIGYNNYIDFFNGTYNNKICEEIIKEELDKIIILFTDKKELLKFSENGWGCHKLINLIIGNNNIFEKGEIKKLKKYIVDKLKESPKIELRGNGITESDKNIINNIKFNYSIELAQNLVKALTFEEEYIIIEIEDLKLKIDRKPIYECLHSQFSDRNEIYLKNIEISMLRNKKSNEEIEKQIELIKSKRLLTRSDFDKIKNLIGDERLISKLFNLNLYNESISRFSLLDTKGIWLLDDEIANIRKNPDLVRKNFDKLRERPYNIGAQIEDKFVILNDDNDYYLKALVHLVSDVK